MGIHTMGIYGSNQGSHSQQPLVKQSLWFGLKLREVEENMGKPLGSMNLGELLNNLTKIEANDRVSVSAPSANSLQLQASLTLVKALSGRTVDEVWREINHGIKSKFDQKMECQDHERVPSLGDITLENFIIKVGIFVAESSLAPTMRLDPMLSAPQTYEPRMGLPSSPSVETLSDVPDNHKRYIDRDVIESSMAPTMGLDPMLSAPRAYAQHMGLPSSSSVETLSDVPDNDKRYIEGDVTQSSLSPTMGLDPMLSAPRAYAQHMGLPSSPSVETLSDVPDNHKRYIEGDVTQSSLAPTMRLDTMLSVSRAYAPHMGLPSSPSIEILSDAPENHKKYFEGDVIETTLDKKLKRKIKNRESAARSRARKQAYENELISKVSHLEEVNMKLKKEKEFDNMLPYKSSSQTRYQLRRTSSF